MHTWLKPKKQELAPNLFLSGIQNWLKYVPYCLGLRIVTPTKSVGLEAGERGGGPPPPNVFLDQQLE